MTVLAAMLGVALLGGERQQDGPLIR
jgi:hypothetical protein